jgi:predicted O-methyltransferase YrrM
MTVRTFFRAGIYFLVTYVTAIPRIVYRVSLSPVVDPKGAQIFMHQVLNAIDVENDDPCLCSVDAQDLFDARGDIQIVGPYYLRRESDTRILLELACLGYVVKHLNPKLVFEIGTYIGRTTRLFALNSRGDCNIITLDLPQSSVMHDVGADYHNTVEASRIHQLYGDSRTFDFSHWFNKCDFVWVDACHDYDYVISDSRNALKLCRSGGWIGWHDYRHSAWWSGVTRTVRSLRRDYPGLRHLRGTTIALLKKP